jgi:hypothetical protein
MPRGKDSRDHPGRRPVDPRITNTQDNDDAPPHGIPRPDTSNIRHEDDAPPHGIPRPNLDEVLDPWDPEDVEEEYNLKEERLKKGHY